MKKLSKKKVSKRKNPCPIWSYGFNPSTKLTRFRKNPDDRESSIMGKSDIKNDEIYEMITLLIVLSKNDHRFENISRIIKSDPYFPMGLTSSTIKKAFKYI